MAWIYYNKSIISNFPPHYEITEYDVADAKRLLRYYGATLIRYTTDFDLNCKTNWWYSIKDDQFDSSELSSSDRYEITKGRKRNTVEVIDDVFRYMSDLYEVYLSAFRRYSKNDVPLSRKDYLNRLFAEQNSEIEYVGVFSNSNGKLVGYSKNYVFDDYVSLSTVKFDPDYLKDGSSAALFVHIIQRYIVDMKKRYVLDGERSIRHETNIQEYLEKYFRFRKAYCHLHIIYNRKYEPLVEMLYRLRLPLLVFNEKVDNRNLNNICALIKQEEIRRSFPNY